MEIQEITVYRKSDDVLITRIFQDGDCIKQITSDDYAVSIKTKDPQNCGKSNEIKVAVKVTGIDEVIKKVEQLHGLLKETKTLADELASGKLLKLIPKDKSIRGVLHVIKTEENIEVLEVLAKVIEKRIDMLKCLDELEKEQKKKVQETAIVMPLKKNAEWINGVANLLCLEIHDKKV